MDVINACSPILDWSSFQFSKFSNMTIAVAFTSNFFLPFHVPFCLTHRKKKRLLAVLKKREQEVVSVRFVMSLRSKERLISITLLSPSTDSGEVSSNFSAAVRSYMSDRKF